MQKWKIIVWNLNGRGGMLHYGSQFSNALAQQYDIRVIIPSYTETNLFENEVQLWKIRTNPSIGSFILDSLNIFAHISLIRKIVRFRPDFVIIVDNHPWYIPYGIIAKLLGSPLFVIQHDPFPHSGESRGIFHTVAIWVNTFLRKICDKLVVHGEKMRDRIITEYGLAPQKVQSIYHGSYDVFHANEKDRAPETRTFLFFGRIVDYKWLDLLLEAVRILIKKEISPFRLIIAWEGNMDKYNWRIREIPKQFLEIDNRFIHDEEISKFFERSGFIVLPYKDATASGIIPLAYSFSLPVIATDVGVLGEYVQDNQTGLLLDDTRPETIANAIEKLLDDPVFTQELWKKAYAFQKNELSWKSIIESIFS